MPVKNRAAIEKIKIFRDLPEESEALIARTRSIERSNA